MRAPHFVIGMPISRKTAEARVNNGHKAKRATVKGGDRTAAIRSTSGNPTRSRIQRQTRKARTGGCK